MKRRSKPSKPEILMRQVDIAAVTAWISIRAEKERGADPEMKSSAVLELRGTLTEPVRGVRDVVISVHASDDTKVGVKPVPWIGLVNGAKPVLRPSVFISHRDFDRVCSIASAGLLKHAHLTLTEPRYNSAYVARISFVTEPEE